MSYEPFKNIGTRKFTNLSGSGTLQSVGNAYLEGTLSVSGAVTLDGPASGSAAGPGSYLGLSTTAAPVLTNPTVLRKKPINCQFTSSAADTITLVPVGIDSRAIVPIINAAGTDLLNKELTASLTMDFTAATGSGGLDTGTVDTSDQGYYVYLITKNGGEDPALMGSLSRNAPTMPPQHGATAAYTYRSEALFFAFYNTSIEPFVNRADGWTYCRDQGLTSGTSTTLTYANLSAYLPVSGTAGVNVICRNTGTTARILYIYLPQIGGNSDGNRGGTSFFYVDNLGKMTDGSGVYIQPFYVEFPVAAGGETLGYDWNGSVTSGVNFVQLGWKTEVYS